MSVTSDISIDRTNSLQSNPEDNETRRRLSLLKDKRFAGLLDDSLKVFFWDTVKTSIKNPSQAWAFIKTVRQQKKAAETRKKYAGQGIHVPPIMLYSITSRCNLHCKGCYHRALRGESVADMPADRVKKLVAEAKELGISFIVLAGGEPFVRDVTLEITGENKEMLFFIFTNGLLINDEMVAAFKKHRNVVPIISVEGYQAETDGRRGTGVNRQLEEVITRLKKNGIFWGTSVTLTRANHSTVVNHKFVESLNKLGCKLFFFVEYSPVAEGTEDWVITETQRETTTRAMAAFRKQFSALFISVPGDEEQFGGCLAAGRGFIHVSADGNVEPCPFVPYSDANLNKVSLKAALQSQFLAAVRGNSDHLEEGPGGCSLWHERQWLESLLQDK
jgi:MoaA/NifB/PqqE/SkfB family radical SAM enzyme